MSSAIVLPLELGLQNKQHTLYLPTVSKACKLRCSHDKSMDPSCIASMGHAVVHRESLLQFLTSCCSRRAFASAIWGRNIFNLSSTAKDMGLSWKQLGPVVAGGALYPDTLTATNRPDLRLLPLANDHEVFPYRYSILLEAETLVSDTGHGSCCRCLLADAAPSGSKSSRGI